MLRRATSPVARLALVPRVEGKCKRQVTPGHGSPESGQRTANRAGGHTDNQPSSATLCLMSAKLGANR